jgi:hypothetical protein
MFNGKKWYTHKCSMCCRGWVRITKIKIRCPGVRIFLFNYSNGLDHRFKGIVSRDFLIQFFHESSSPIPWKLNFGLFIFFGKFVEISASQGAPPVSTILVANLPKLSMIPVVNLYRWCCWYWGANMPKVSITPVVIFRWCQWHWWQIMGTISNCFTP